MKPALKVAGILAGYVAAFLLASAVEAVRVADTSGPDARAASGMYAFGDAVVFTAVFGVAALVPTGAALLLLRSHRGFWTVLAAIARVIAATGVAAVILFLAGRHAPRSLLGTLGALSVLRLLAAPLLSLAFLVCTVFSQEGPARRRLLSATVAEVIVSGCGAAALFIPMWLHRS